MCSLQASRRYASTSSSSEQKSSNIATVFLGIGVAAAGGYWYLSRNSPETLVKAENAVGLPGGAVAGAVQSALGNSASTTSKTPGILDPSKFVNIKLKEIQVRLYFPFS